MRILVVGGTGTIGKAVVNALGRPHHLVVAGRTSGDQRVDLAAPESIRALYARLGSLDAVVSCAGQAAFGPLADLADDDFDLGLRDKLMGQVNLVRFGSEALHAGGSFTLTSGVLAHEPGPGSSAVSLASAGLEGFVRAAAIELPRGLRINAVSPPWVRETLQQMGLDPAPGLPAAVVARAYVASIGGTVTGEVLDARAFA